MDSRDSREPEPGERREIKDFLVAVAAPGYDPSKGGGEESMRRSITGMGKQYTWAQYTNAPFDIEFTEIEVFITSSPQEVEDFKLNHDCETCRVAQAEAVTHLEENPGVHMALANLTYVEVWP